MTIELGGDITLEGFDDLDGGELVVVKKIVGRYARRMSDNAESYDGLTVSVKKDDNFELTAEMEHDDGKYTSEVENDNLYMGLDEALQNIIEQI